MHYLVYDIRSEAVRETKLLSPAELDATERAASAARGEEYLLMRTILRQELARRCGKKPPEVRFSYTESGKPICEEQPFNISHSGDLICIAFHHNDIGVDIQRVRPLPRMAAVAGRVFSAEQVALWQERGAMQEEFFTAWCIAEALVKLAGGSIHTAATQFPFLYDGSVIRFLFSPSPITEIFTPAPGYAGVVAFFP